MAESNVEKSGSNAATWQEDSEFLTLDFGGDRETPLRWRKLPDCDAFVGERRSKHTMVVYRDAIYIFGGDDGKKMLSDLLRFDPSDDSWGRAFMMGALPAPRYHHTAVVYGSSMFVFGGYTGNIHSNSNLTNKNDLFEYRFSTGQWCEVRCEGRLPQARSGHGASVYDGKLWVFGGFDGHKRLNDMWSFQLNAPTKCWQEIEQKGDWPQPCHNFASAPVGECLYLFSGQSGAKSTISLYQFHYPSQVWTRINTEHILRASPPPPPMRYGHTMVAHARKLYVFGGAAENIYTPDLHCYDLDTHTWSVVRPCGQSNCPSGRMFHSAVLLDDAMYVFGGTVDKIVRCSEIFRFQFANYPRCTLQDDFGRLLDRRQFCDVRFIVGKERVPVYGHAAIVAARCGYLRNKIRQCGELQPSVQQPVVAPHAQSDDSQANSTDENAAFAPNLLDVFIADAEPLAFQMLMEYIYRDRIDPSQIGQQAGSNDVVLLMMDIYRLSLQFSMTRLEELTVIYLQFMLGPQNVLLVLENANRLNLAFIKEYCLRFIIKECNYSQIVMSKEFESLDQPLMVEIIRRRQVPSTRAVSDAPLRRVQSQSLPDEMREFLETGAGSEFCDITLVCGDLAVPAHKVVLAARSAYFEAMFRNWMPESNSVQVKLGEVELTEQAFRSLLRYLYYGDTSMAPEDSLYLFSAPQFFGFTNNRLQVLCKENLETSLQTENVLEVLEAAERIGALEMKRHALRLVSAHFTLLVTGQLPRLRRLSKELLLDIIMAVAQGGGDAAPLADSSAADFDREEQPKNP